MNEKTFTEEDLKYLQSKKFLIATPCYGGMVSVGYLNSSLDLISIAVQNNINIETMYISNESLITRGRNNIITQFYNSDHDYLMFIDADIEFNALDVFRLAIKKLDIVAAAYPMKKLNLEAIANKNMSLEEIQNTLPIYASNLEVVEKDGEKTINVINGALEAVDVATGFMLIKRSVIEKMVDAYPELHYFSDEHIFNPETGKNETTKEKKYGLFDTYIDRSRELPRYLSEDYAFCRRWQHLGGKVYLDPLITLNHVGHYIFQGRPIIDFDKFKENIEPIEKAQNE